MKVYKIYAHFAERETSYEEHFFTFDCGESDKYFAEADGEWVQAIWLTKGGGGTLSTDDLDCWVDRIPGRELTASDCNRLTCNMLSGNFTLAANLAEGESAIYVKRDRYYVSVFCIYDGSVEDCPIELQFYLARSEKEV
jgi:hypothetical protein